MAALWVAVSPAGAFEAPRWPDAAAPTAMCLIGRNSSSTPRYATWSGSAWGSSAALPWSASDDVRSVAGQACPTRDEALIVVVDRDKDLRAARYNGTSWGSATTLTTDVKSESERPFDVAYESVSGDGLIVYWNDDSSNFAYRTWNGTSFSSEVSMTGSGADHSHYISLTSNPATDEIILLCQDHDSDVRLLARVWSGSSWSSWFVAETDAPNEDYESFAASWERQTGRGMIVYGESGQSQPRYRTWNGSSWSGESSVPSIGNEPLWIRLASDPSSNTILLVAGDSSDDIEANVWNGSSWGSTQQFENDSGGHSTRRFDIAFEPGASEALCLYREGNRNYPMYRTWNGSAWSAEQSGTNINRKPTHIQICTGFSAGELFLCVGDDSDDLHLMRWSGSAMSSNTVIESDFASGQQPACIVAAPSSMTKRKLVNWTEVEPN